jgi:phosphoglycolate phosphatase
VPYSLAIFDLDGTLADSFPWFLRVFNEVADEFGFRRIEGDAEIEALRRAGSREIIARLGVPLWKLPMIARHMRRLKTQHIADIPLFSGTQDMLHTLSAKGVQLALVSSDHEANVRRQLGADLAGLFAHFACGASLFGKAAKFKNVIRKSGVRPERVIAIGDEVRDAEAAAKAGIAFGAVTWGYADPQALRRQKPTEFFVTMNDIVARL